MQFVDLRLLNTCEIMGVNIVVTDMEKTVRLLEEKLEDWRGKYICVANVHTTVTAHDDPTYQAVQNGAVMALPDGGPLSKFSREQGYVDAARVTGPDLMKEMLKESADKHYRHYFYGSTQETLDILKATIEKNYPGAVIAGMYSPPFRPLTPEEDAARHPPHQRDKAGFRLGRPGCPQAGALDGRPRGQGTGRDGGGGCRF